MFLEQNLITIYCVCTFCNTHLQVSPSHARRILQHQLQAGHDRQPVDCLETHQIRRYQNKLYLIKPNRTKIDISTISTSVVCQTSLRADYHYTNTTKTIFQKLGTPPWNGIISPFLQQFQNYCDLKYLHSL